PPQYSPSLSRYKLLYRPRRRGPAAPVPQPPLRALPPSRLDHGRHRCLMTRELLRVAIIGCGKIADQHALAIRRSGRGALVAACDSEMLMASQLAERFEIGAIYDSVDKMLAECRPDVVHITAPPVPHYRLGSVCLKAGCHVYIEKPFTVNTSEASALEEMARQRGRLMIAGHNLQFTAEALAMRRLVAAGYLGGRPVHLERHFSYSLDDQSYLRPVIANPDHWVRRLPGRLFHNIISHGIASLAEFLDGEIVSLKATSHQSERMRRLGCADLHDELRVNLRDEHGTTAFFCFTTQAKPALNQLRIVGPQNSLLVDFATGSLIRLSGASAKSYLTFVLPPRRLAREYAANARRNLVDILRRRLFQDAGMGEMTAQFYRAIVDGAPSPLPMREILLTSKIMDLIFEDLRSADTEPAPVSASSTRAG
ncbi:MAG: Gfo/Idh/MocA family oxidoreductase, partial [Bryobacteraceae bacterium]|nr:Gfo/Idh/MocA family oxidoreductase [Bryobacteraceae bacterium]